MPGGTVHRFSHRAMAAEFEALLVSDDALYAGQAAEAVFDEIDRLERQLSRFIPNSDIAQLNSLAPGSAIRIGEATMDCLLLACELFEMTGGALDITFGSSLPAGESGMKHLGLDPARHCAGVTEPGVRFDLGGLGKGYALDRAALLLREWGILNARLHAGHSTVLTLGALPGESDWSIEVRDPRGEPPDATLGRVRLKDEAISGSDSRIQPGHIVDPRTGEAAEGKLGSWALTRSAALSDGLSTACFIMDDLEISQLCQKRGDLGALILIERAGEPQVATYGRFESVWTVAR